MAQDTVVITSTTDTLEQVQAALSGPPKEEAKTEAQPEAKAEAQTEKPAVEAKPSETPAKAPAEEAKPSDADESAKETESDGEQSLSEKRAEAGRRGGESKSRLDKRIKQLVDERERYKATSTAKDIELEVLRKRVAELAAADSPKETSAKAADDGDKGKKPAAQAPQPKDFDSYDDYVLAAAKFAADAAREEMAAKVVEEALAKERARLKGEADAAAQLERQKAVQERLEAARQRYDDFDEVVDPNIPLNRTLVENLQDSEIGPDVAYYLCKHEDELQKLLQMGDTARASRAFGVIEDKVAASLEKAAAKAEKAEDDGAGSMGDAIKPEGKPAEKKAKAVATKAPDPISPTKGATQTEKRPEDMSYAEYRAFREKQESARRRSGLL